MILSFLLSLFPFTELRFAIPLVISYGLDPWAAFFSGVLGNLLVIPLAFFFLDFFHAYLLKFKFYNDTFNFFIKRVRKKEKKIKKQLGKYGFVALTILVILPLPVTGAYTGVLLAWLLNLERRKSMLAIAAGVLLAGILVTLASVGIINLINAS